MEYQEWGHGELCWHLPVLFPHQHHQQPSELILSAHPTLSLKVSSLFLNSLSSEISSLQQPLKEVLICRAQPLKQFTASNQQRQETESNEKHILKASLQGGLKYRSRGETSSLLNHTFPTFAPHPKRTSYFTWKICVLLLSLSLKAALSEDIEKDEERGSEGRSCPNLLV